MSQSQNVFGKTVNKKCLVGGDQYCFENQLNCREVRNVNDDNDDDDDDDDDVVVVVDDDDDDDDDDDNAFLRR